MTHKSLLGGARIARKDASISCEGETATVDGVQSLDDGSLPERLNLGSLSSPSPSLFQNPQLGADNQYGYTGLSNLGNTCFMSCVLQALANTTELRDYFLTKSYEDDINEKNPLGMQGRLAKAFYFTLKHLWSGELTTYAPTKLKAIIGSRAPQFLGFLQHDAQEFMAFFLDALHEDLNRVQEKPNFELPELDENTDFLIAEKIWNLHKSRNDSFVVDKFHGMYKSKLSCPSCHKVSTTFDPFLFLPVPIPKPKKCITVTLFQRSGTPSHINAVVPEEGATVSDIFAYINGHVNASLRASCLRVFETRAGSICKELLPASSVPCAASQSSIVVCEVSNNHEEGFLDVRVLQRVKVENHVSRCTYCGKSSMENDVKVQRCTKCKEVGYCSRICQKDDWPTHRAKCRETFIGCPFVLSINASQTTSCQLKERLLRFASFSVDGPCSSYNDLESLESENGDLPSHCNELFSIFLCYNGNIRSGCLVRDSGTGPLNLQDVTHVIVEWAAGAGEKVLSRRLNRDHKPNIQDCIRLFTEPEILAEEEAWYCPRCKKHRQATKELSLWKLPEILIIQLKRFSFRNRIWRDKIDRLVDFPIDGLDMSPFCISDQEIDRTYDLYAVINHHGGLFGGHYTSYVSLNSDAQTSSNPLWRLCDDSRVTDVNDPCQLVTETSYVLFYRRRHTHGMNPMKDLGTASFADIPPQNDLVDSDMEMKAVADEGNLESDTNPCHFSSETETTEERSASASAIDEKHCPQTSLHLLETSTTSEASGEELVSCIGNPIGLDYTDMDAID